MTGLTTLTMPTVAVVVHARWRPSDPVQKSPSFPAGESWLSTVVFAGLPTVSRTIGFR
jgi:hypothetical protein